MLGIVTASRLHVRTKPDKNSSSRGLLTKGTAIPITGQTDNWIEFRYQDFPAYVYKSYVSIQDDNRNISAITTANLLNVRSNPDIHSNIIGKLPKSSRVDVISLLPQWAEIHFNGAVGYISRDYIRLQQQPDATNGKVIASLLNVRSQPNASSEKLGQLSRNAHVKVLAKHGDWLQIYFNDLKGFVHSHYVQLLEDDDLEPVRAQDIDQDLPPDAVRTQTPSSLAPIQQLPMSGDDTERAVASTWNKYGNLLQELSSDKEIDKGCAVAVLCVESAGRGFQPSNQNRMVIRFENHKFWKYWGKQNPEIFKQHFSYQSGQAWKGHKWRKTPDDTWQTFHGNQTKEWQVLQFARTFNDDAALLSISMGAPQIMGFHYQRIGYHSVQDMFNDFAEHIEAHIRGLFSFLDNPMINALQALNFETFAGYYNGSGQKQVYGQKIKKHYDAFKHLSIIHGL